MHPRGFSSDHGFVEVADRCWSARQVYLDVNVGVVAGERGLLVVDSHASEALARPVVDQVRRLAAGEVVAVVNTHAHFDHFFGNAAFEEAYAGVAMFAHDTAASDMPGHADRIRRSMQPDEPYYDEVTSSRLVVPPQTFSSARVVDLGDRQVELIHPGRGHTAGDVVVRVPDAEVLFAGDLVEESTLRHGVPGFGEDCYPLEWPATLDLVVSMLSEASVVLPGHGLPVDKDFVQEQRSSIGIVAETIRDLAERGVRPAEMATAGDWPYPVEELAEAFARGFEQLPRSGKGLPLL
jgi:glyoxylase-like metal-dependent hydrolase (beta-lactamase superfamily II)